MPNNFNYPFEDKGGSPIEKMLTPGERNHRWYDVSGAERISYVSEMSSAEYDLSDRQMNLCLSPIDKLEGALNVGLISKETEKRLMEVSGLKGVPDTAHITDALEALVKDFKKTDSVYKEVLGDKEVSSLSILDKVIINDDLKNGKFSDQATIYLDDKLPRKLDVRDSDKIMGALMGLDKDDEARVEIESIIGREIIDMRNENNDLPTFDRYEFEASAPPINNFFVCSQARAKFWDGAEKLDKPKWAFDYTDHNSIIGVVKETYDGYDFKVFIPTKYKVNSHSVRDNIVYGCVMAEGKCSDPKEAMTRASYYIENCATLDIRNTKYSFKEELITTKRNELNAISKADKSFRSHMENQRKEQFAKLPEKEQERRREYAKSMQKRSAGNLEERGKKASKLSGSQNKNDVLSKIRSTGKGAK